MTTNVSFEFANAKKKYDSAKTPMEKLLALQEMRSTAPSHKGAEKLRADISRKISQLKRELEKEKAKEKARKASAASLNVKKEGAGQIVIVGMPNSGKSTLLNKLTGLNIEVASFPFTTTKPEIGMMNYNGALVQIVELPAIIKGSIEGKASGTQLFSIIRNADAVILLFRNWDEKKTLLEEFHAANIKLNEDKPAILIKPSKFKGITFAGSKFLKVKESQLIDFLKDAGLTNVEVVINQPTSLADIAEVLDSKIVYKPAIIIDPTEIYNLEAFKEKVFKLLDKILVFTKKPGEEVRKDKPLVLERDSTIDDAAEHLHKEFAKKFRYAKVWGSTKFPGQRVSRNYELKDGDIVEIYA